MRILLATDGSEQSESTVDEIADRLIRDGREDASRVEQLSSPEMFSDETLYGSHCGDRENYTRTGACGSRISGNTANVAAAIPEL